MVGRVCCYLGRDILGDDLANLVAILPFDVSELIIEGFDYIAELVQFGLWLTPTPLGGNRFMSLSAWCISKLNMVDALDDLFVGNGGRIYDPLYEVPKQV